MNQKQKIKFVVEEEEKESYKSVSNDNSSVSSRDYSGLNTRKT